MSHESQHAVPGHGSLNWKVTEAAHASPTFFVSWTSSAVSSVSSVSSVWSVPWFVDLPKWPNMNRILKRNLERIKRFYLNLSHLCHWVTARPCRNDHSKPIPGSSPPLDLPCQAVKAPCPEERKARLQAVEWCQTMASNLRIWAPKLRFFEKKHGSIQSFSDIYAIHAISSRSVNIFKKILGLPSSYITCI